MVDKLTPEKRSANMGRIRSKDTKPEIAVRRLVHAMGYRFRLHRKDLPGKPDLVFPGRRAVIFVHGCFWHQHSAEACLDGRKPKSNTGYWSEKLERNVRRDAVARESLIQAGWTVLTVWECEIRDTARLRERIGEFLQRSPPPTASNSRASR